MKARGKREARRPWFYQKAAPRPERPKYARSIPPFSGLVRFLINVTRGDVPTSRDLPLAIIFRAFGAPTIP